METYESQCQKKYLGTLAQRRFRSDENLHWAHFGHPRLQSSFMRTTKTHRRQLLTLKMPRKPASENVVCLCRLLNILTNFSNFFCIQANSVDPDQTAPRGAVINAVCKNDFKIISR